jgi:nucleotide-binding universal stress UspA family protein
MTPLGARLLVGMVGRRPDIRLIRYASMVARLGGAGVSATTSEDGEVRFVALLPGKRRCDAGQNRVLLREKVRRYFTGPPTDVPVGCDVLAGQVVSRLTELAVDFDSDLLLAGDSRWRARTRARLAVEAPCSVWLVPPDWAPVLRHLLVPVDFSEASRACLETAARIVRRSRGARCIALHVHHPDDPSPRGLNRKLISFLGSVDTLGVRVTPLLHPGLHVASIIGHVAQEQASDLVVMAARGRSRWSAAIHASVTEETIRYCRASFLVLRKKTRPLGLVGALAEQLKTRDMKFA